MTAKRKTLQAKLIAWAAAIALLIGLLPACAGADSVTVTADNAFTFSNSGITTALSGAGYEISGTDLTITAAGTYEAYTKTFTPNPGVTVDEDYVSRVSALAQNKETYAKYLISENYYQHVFPEWNGGF